MDMVLYNTHSPIMKTNTAVVAASLLSICLGIFYWETTSFWEKIGTFIGSDVKTKSDLEEIIDADRLREYNLSPFEMHWPGWRLSPWMRKWVERYPSKSKEVCLVHVGKVRIFINQRVV